mmetsp:Transcript_72406/g.204674  ORF Transcript_72406/g.204674 Transcript_72406/m.204674 type:complete len:865 (+) Transcript_72406:200-2794(+)
MRADWQKLADLWYRKQEVYAAHWSDEPERFRLSMVAGAPYGGPVATVRDERVFQPSHGSLKAELQTWTSAGRPIARTDWNHTGLLAMGWSAQETLVCVFETGVVRVFSVLCERLGMFTIDERIKSEGNAILAALWPTGIALLTRKYSLFVNTSMERSSDACHRCADLRVPSAPTCICVLPPPHEESADVQVIVGTGEGPVRLVDRHEVRDLGLENGPYIAFAVSASGRFIACLSKRGGFKVLAIKNNLQVVDEANLDIRNGKKPKQMVWLGDDCIALYFEKSLEKQSSFSQNVLFVGGPQNDWIPYQYDSPIYVVSEVDGCRILGSKKVEFVQRVPQSTEQIYSIGNYDPPAMLCYAQEKFDSGDVRAQESIRHMKDDLADAVATCIDAAKYEHDLGKVEPLLKAGVFGRHFLPEPMDPKHFMETCRSLRICIELRNSALDIPLTVPQLERLGIAGLAMRLAQRRQHLLAVRICEWVGHPRDEVLFHWACEKIRQAKSSASNEELYQVILKKFRGCPGIGYARVARVATEVSRNPLAVMLLDLEPRVSSQVEVLLQLNREQVDEDPQGRMMLRRAIEKAAHSSDPDLLHGVILATCGGDLRDTKFLAQLLKERPELQVVGDVFAQMLLAAQQLESARTFHDSLERAQRAAFTEVHQVFKNPDVSWREMRLRFAKDSFGRAGGQGVPEAERLSTQSSAQACAEEAELLKKQAALEELGVQKHWLNGPHRFLGLSLVDTLSKLIKIGEVVEADHLHTQMNVSWKRYWRIKVRALSDAGNLTELNTMATALNPPSGYEQVIEAFLKHDRRDLARPFVPKVKNPEQQANYYARMGMDEEAQAARAQAQQQASGFGSGRFLQNILRLSQ